MAFRSILLILAIGLSTTSCIQIIDEIFIKNDGTGTFKYTINLSRSKTKINSLLALDSVDGKKVPSIQEIKTNIEKVELALSECEGISNVKIEQDFTNFVFVVSCSFQTLLNLQQAVKKIVSEEVRIENKLHFDHDWLSWDGKSYKRSFPELSNKSLEKLSAENLESLKQGTYSAITKFESPVLKTTNPKALISPNKMNVMLKHSIFECVNNHRLQENTITIQK